jgi:hypothetical protein
MTQADLCKSSQQPSVSNVVLDGLEWDPDLGLDNWVPQRLFDRCIAEFLAEWPIDNPERDKRRKIMLATDLVKQINELIAKFGDLRIDVETNHSIEPAIEVRYVESDRWGAAFIIKAED